MGSESAERSSFALELPDHLRQTLLRAGLAQVIGVSLQSRWWLAVRMPALLRIVQQKILQPSMEPCGDSVLLREDGSSDVIGEAVEVQPPKRAFGGTFGDLPADGGDHPVSEVIREEPTVESTHRRAVSKEHQPAALLFVELEHRGHRHDRPLAMSRQQDPPVGLADPAHSLLEVRHASLRITGRCERVEGSGPKSKEIPEDADAPPPTPVTERPPSDQDKRDRNQAHEPRRELADGAPGRERLQWSRFPYSAHAAPGEDQPGSQDLCREGEGHHEGQRDIEIVDHPSEGPAAGHPKAPWPVVAERVRALTAIVFLPDRLDPLPCTPPLQQPPDQDACHEHNEAGRETDCE